ncbi:hypothetical protein PMIN04_000234 [Paraphaeosphaeria minitans]
MRALPRLAHSAHKDRWLPLLAEKSMFYSEQVDRRDRRLPRYYPKQPYSPPLWPAVPHNTNTTSRKSRLIRTAIDTLLLAFPGGNVAKPSGWHTAQDSRSAGSRRLTDWLSRPERMHVRI